MLVGLDRYDLIRSLRQKVRPWSHILRGEKDLARVVRQIKQARTTPVLTILDIGAYLGDTTILFLRTFPEAWVHCIEPQSIPRMRMRSRISRYSARVTIHPIGLYNVTTDLPFHLYRHPYASSLLPIQGFDRENEEIGKESVRFRQTDEWAMTASIDHVDLMKIDVEGVELEVLQGAPRLLKRTDNVYVEINPMRKGPFSGDHVEIFKILHRAGFEFLGCYGDYWFSKDKDVLRWFGI